MSNSKRRSVLVADDESMNLIALTDILESEYEIYAASDGASAIKLAGGFLPDVILLDIVMPDMDGYDVITSLKRSERTKNIPVIFISGLTESADEEKGLSLGAADYITKPFSHATVKLRVRNQINILEALERVHNANKAKNDLLFAMSHKSAEFKKDSILIVDDERTNIIALTDILESDYEIYAASDGADAIELAETLLPDMILLDVLMPDMDGYATITELKKSEKTKNIPVIFLTGMTDPESEIKGLNAGAVDYILKPFSRDLLLKRVELHLKLNHYSSGLETVVAQKTQAVHELQDAVLETFSECVDCRDSVTGGHIERTKNYLRLLVNLLMDNGIYTEELSAWDIDLLVTSSQLHDVGKISISDSILMKPGKLTDEEFSIMKKHAQFGREIIEKIERRTAASSFLEHAKLLAGNHHEKWDGTGYPFGLKGDEIPLQGRLMAIVDVYDALTNDRPYKKAFTHEEAVDIIKSGLGTHFDPLVCEIFFKHHKEFEKLRMQCSFTAVNTANTLTEGKFTG